MAEIYPRGFNDEFEEALEGIENAHYLLRLFVAGNTRRSAQAIVRLREICESELQGRYKLEVIDIYQQTSVAKEEEIIATPTLIKYLPLPIRRIIGDLSETEHVLVRLGIQPLDS